MDRVVTIYINREQEAVVVKEPGPPQQGGRTEMAHGKHHRPGKNFQDTIANVQHTPSFIGENATCKLIDLSQRSSWAILSTVLAKMRDAVT